MNRERWERVADTYQAALERDPSQRAAFLSDACRDDDDLRCEVASLLAQDDAVGPLDEPMLDTAADVFATAAELTPGSRLGAYEIECLLGEGGMGRVYRARDTKLGRSVALKLLPSDVDGDVDRLTRFRREAHVLASLNHTGIGAIYGFEEGPLSDPQNAEAPSAYAHALVLELVEGPTLADRIARGPIAVDEAITIASQIAEALHAAHEQRIVHRDLKPANIKLRIDGTVKVLDFGLAKLAEPRPNAECRAVSGSPTLPGPAVVTVAGVILGTAAYMSPEQARGENADERSDIWSFGCVLYEMLAGRRAFDGGSVADAIATVLTSDPDWDALPAGTPKPIRRLLERSLLKDRRRRISDMSVVLYLIGEGVDESAGASVTSTTLVRPTRPRLMPALVGGVAAGLLLAGAAGWAFLQTRAEAPPEPVRFEVITPASQSFWPGALQSVAVSPDGTRIVYRAGEGSQSRLVLRALNDIVPRPIRGATGAGSPFFSRDGRSVGFFGSGQLKRIPVEGGTPIEVCPHGSPQRGATWGADDAIVFATADRATGLLRVLAGGGAPTVLTMPDEARGELDHWFPEVLPDDRGFLFTIVRGQPEKNQIAVLDPKTGEQKILIEGGSQAAYVDSGHLVYAAADQIRAVRFDLDALTVLSDPAQVVERVLTTRGTAQFAVSPVGTLVYVSSDSAPAEPQRSLVWVDRQGRERPLGTPSRAFTIPRLSPDGTRIALAVGEQDQSIWLWDRSREILTPLTGETGSESHPVWTSDGSRLIFSSERGGSWNLYWQAADGSGAAEALFGTPHPQYAHSVAADGLRVFLTQLSGPPTAADIAVLAVGHNPRAELLVRTPAQESGGEVSPDGRWLAYQSNESGNFEVYLRPQPDVVTRRLQLSNNGGTRPAWARSGREVFFFDRLNRLTTVTLDSDGSTLIAGKPTTLFESKYFADPPLFGRPYDVSSNGQFLMIKENAPTDSQDATRFVVVEHWREELKRLVSPR